MQSWRSAQQCTPCQLLLWHTTLKCICRTSRPGECGASEGSLMCEDFLRAGHARMVVDPSVRQAYFPATARMLYTDQARPHAAPLCAPGLAQ